MKKIFIITVLFSSHLLLSQINLNSPWLKDLKINPDEKLNYNSIIMAGEKYWETHDKFSKGSGYKPFKRWETYWHNYVDEQGFLPSADELFKVWSEKNLQARLTNQSLNDQSDWISMGPNDFLNRPTSYLNLGRINCVTPHPENSEIVFAGAPSGGIWKSSDGGLTYIPLSDNLPQIGVSSIAIDYNNPNIMYIATGDDDAGDSYSVGIWKSIDGGLNWNPTSLGPSNSPSSIYEIEMHFNDPNIMWAATNGGLYKTTNGGENWIQTQSGAFQGVKQKPNNPNTLYAITASEFYKSNNGGDSFVVSGTGLYSESARLVLDVTAANENLVYVVASTSNYGFEGVYRSSDSGSNFVKMANTVNIYQSNQAWFDLALAVSDSNENELYVGVLNIWKSSDGGDSFTQLNNWGVRDEAYTHADIHFLKFYNNELYVGSDGGYFKSNDQGNTFTDFTGNMAIGQFYRVSVSKQTSNKIAGGTQDNGGFAYFNDWNIYHGGDGMESVIDPNNDNKVYGFMQSGQTLFVSNNSGMSGTQGYSGPENGNWITPLSINSDSEVFAGYNSLYQFENGEFSQISTNLIGGNIDVLELDPMNSDIIYVAINSSLKKSSDHGITFTNIQNFSNNITSIEVNNNDNNIIYVTTRGSGGRVYKSVDQGINFSDITGTLPGVTKNIIKHQPDTPDNVLYLGTSLGVYRYDEGLNTWRSYNTGLPNVSVTDLSINLPDNKIIASTYGRGVWQSEMATSALASDDVKIVEIISPTSNTINCGLVDTQIRVKNNGQNTINEILITYSISDNTPFGNQNFEQLWTGELLSLDTEIIDLETLDLNQGSREMEVSVSIENDTFDSNNYKSVIFQVNDSGIAQSVMTFETSADRLLEVAEYGSKNWEFGVPDGENLNSVSSGQKVYGTNLDGNYLDNSKTYLYTPCYNLTNLSDPILKFDMAFDIEFDWDLLYLEYSNDQGQNWNILGNSDDPNWYNSSRISGDGVNNNCYNCVGSQWTGTELEMQEYSYNLTNIDDYNNIIFRFVFHTDEYVNQEGVIIDDLVIEGTTLDVNDFDYNQISVYPNPSSDIFNIFLNNIPKYDIILSDITGKILFEDKNTNGVTNYPLNLERFSNGIYFLKVLTKNKFFTKKLILNK